MKQKKTMIIKLKLINLESDNENSNKLPISQNAL